MDPVQPFNGGERTVVESSLGPHFFVMLVRAISVPCH